MDAGIATEENIQFLKVEKYDYLIMNTQKMVTITVENSKGDTIQIRQCSEPTQDVQLICSKLKYRQIPMPRKKYVWDTGEILRINYASK